MICDEIKTNTRLGLYVGAGLTGVLFWTRRGKMCTACSTQRQNWCSRCGAGMPWTWTCVWWQAAHVEQVMVSKWLVPSIPAADEVVGGSLTWTSAANWVSKLLWVSEGHAFPPPPDDGRISPSPHCVLYLPTILMSHDSFFNHSILGSTLFGPFTQLLQVHISWTWLQEHPPPVTVTTWQLC